MAAAGTSALITSAAASVASLTALTSAGPASRFAPGATVMMFSPPLSTVIMASPVGTPRTVRTAASLTPSATRAARSALPKSSSPTQPAISTSPPSRAAATAWLAPLPPGAKAAAPPSTVAPGAGSRGTVTEMSMFRLPSTVSRALETTGERYSSRVLDGEIIRSR